MLDATNATSIATTAKQTALQDFLILACVYNSCLVLTMRSKCFFYQHYEPLTSVTLFKCI